MQKRNLLIVGGLFLTPFLFGCKESVVTALKHVISTDPTATLGSPSYSPGPNGLGTGGTATISVTFANAHTANLAAGSGSTASAPAGLTVTPSGPSCTTVAVSSVTTSGATISVSGCTGDGTIAIKVNAGAVEDESGVQSPESSAATVNVDTTTPVTTAFTRSKAKTTTSAANVITATFAGRVQDLSATNANGEFTIANCTGTQPNVAIVMTVDGSNNSIATATLSGGACANGNNIDVDLNLDKVTDFSGNDGDPSDNPTTLNFTIDTTVPTATLAVQDAIVGATTGANVVEATFSELIQAISTTNANGAFTITGCTTAPSVAVAMSDDGSGHSIATATLSGGNCPNTNTVTVTLNMDKVTDEAGNAGLVGGNQTGTYDIDTANVSIGLSGPSLDPIDSTQSATITMNMLHAETTTLVDATGTSSAPPAGLVIDDTNGATCTSVVLTNVSSSGHEDWEITFSGCTGTGPITVQVAAGIATSYAGVVSTASASQTVNVVP
jgi:hypothetical protein